jgi:hypothetical protein
VLKGINLASAFRRFEFCDFSGIPCRYSCNSKLDEQFIAGSEVTVFLEAEVKLHLFQEKLVLWGRYVEFGTFAKFPFLMKNQFTCSTSSGTNSLCQYEFKNSVLKVLLFELP